MYCDSQLLYGIPDPGRSNPLDSRCVRSARSYDELAYIPVSEYRVDKRIRLWHTFPDRRRRLATLTRPARAAHDR